MSLTCSGPHSRNMAYGMHLVTKTNKNKTLDLVEGVNALEAVSYTHLTLPTSDLV